MRRVTVVGCSGSGKSTLARAIANRLDLPYVDSDEMHWQADWTPAQDEVLRARVDAATSAESWVFDGNFLSTRDLVWSRADTLIWLDYPTPVILWRVTLRNLTLASRRAEMWNGNRMTWPHALSGIRHAARSITSKRAAYPALIAEYSHLVVLHFRYPSGADRWLASLRKIDRAVIS